MFIHEDICDALLIDFNVIDPLFAGQCSRLQEPYSLVSWVLVELISANVNALVPLPASEAAEGLKEGIDLN